MAKYIDLRFIYEGEDDVLIVPTDDTYVTPIIAAWNDLGNLPGFIPHMSKFIKEQP